MLTIRQTVQLYDNHGQRWERNSGRERRGPVQDRDSLRRVGGRIRVQLHPHSSRGLPLNHQVLQRQPGRKSLQGRHIRFSHLHNLSLTLSLSILYHAHLVYELF